MSYWKSKHGMIGDAAADVVGDAIDEIRGVYRRAMHREPSKGEIRDAVEFVLAPLDELPETGRRNGRPREPAAEVIPFAAIGEASGERYPDWVRELDGENGIYFIRERTSGEVVYIGESHSARLYATLTRHFQRWSDKYNTAGATYERPDVDVAVILVPDDHAPYLQNELICIFDPRDNRLVCGELFERQEDDEARDEHPDDPPPGYDYDVSVLIDSIFYPYQDDSVPF